MKAWSSIVQGKVKANSGQGQGNARLTQGHQFQVNARSSLGQGKVKAKLGQGQGKVKIT